MQTFHRQIPPAEVQKILAARPSIAIPLADIPEGKAWRSVIEHSGSTTMLAIGFPGGPETALLFLIEGGDVRERTAYANELADRGGSVVDPDAPVAPLSRDESLALQIRDVCSRYAHASAKGVTTNDRAHARAVAACRASFLSGAVFVLDALRRHDGGLTPEELDRAVTAIAKEQGLSKEPAATL